jgi:hypothetical protein
MAKKRMSQKIKNRQKKNYFVTQAIQTIGNINQKLLILLQTIYKHVHG